MNIELNLWIEICPWHLNNAMKLKNDLYISQEPFIYPCSDDNQRFKCTIEIPYKIQKVEQAIVKSIESTD